MIFLFIVKELKDNNEFRNAFDIGNVYTADQIYNKLSNLDVDALEKTVNSILKSFIKRKHNEKRVFIVDSTPADLNINHRSKKLAKNHWKIKSMLGLGVLQLVIK